MIKFGTDGWRGVIARDFTYENVQLVALATAVWLKKAFPDVAEPMVVIGYDTRFMSRHFAEESALILAWQGIKVCLADNISSTPQVSFHTKYMGANLGVVITASHNPPIYNGYKVKASFGGPGTPEQVAEIEAELKTIWNNRPAIEPETLKHYISTGQIRLFDAKKPFIDYLKSKIDMDAINAAELKVLYDPMHGAGIDTIHMLLPDADQIHADRNPGFGTIDHPEPIGEMLGELMAKVKAGGYDIGIATDGDADRLGAVDAEGNFVDSHKIFMILMKYLYEVKNMRGAVVKTVSLTSMVDKYCRKMGIELFETPVGFKYTAKMMQERDVLIGGEESGGLGTILHIPERDGLFNAMLLMEAMTAWNKSLKEICDDLENEFGPHKYARRDVVVSQEVKDRILAAAKSHPGKIGPYDVRGYNDKDGYKFLLENGWLLIRPSGTEPLLRFYAEAESLDKVNELLDEGMKLG